MQEERLDNEIIDMMLDRYKDDKYAMTVALGYMNLIASAREIVNKLEDNVIYFLKEVDQCKKD